MSDDLEARLKSVQKDLAGVEDQVRALQEELGGEDASLEKVAAKVAAQLAELNERKNAVDELDRQVEALRQEAAQVRDAVDDP